MLSNNLQVPIYNRNAILYLGYAFLGKNAVFVPALIEYGYRGIRWQYNISLVL